MLDTIKSALKSKTAALAGRVSRAAGEMGEAVRAAALGLGAVPSPVLVPVRVRKGHLATRR